MTITFKYGCDNDREHDQVDIQHGTHDTPSVTCQVCGGHMHKVPQNFSFYNKPLDTLLDRYDQKWRERKAKNHANKIRARRSKQTPQG